MRVALCSSLRNIKGREYVLTLFMRCAQPCRVQSMLRHLAGMCYVAALHDMTVQSCWGMLQPGLCPCFTVCPWHALQAVELLREVASVSPVVYEQQQQADAAGVRIVATFIAELADRWQISSRCTQHGTHSLLDTNTCQMCDCMCCKCLMPHCAIPCCLWVVPCPSCISRQSCKA